MRDHTKLKAFHLADETALAVYKATSDFPRSEVFGLTAQMRRSAVSVPSNIVEGCARHTEADYLRFLDTAFASAKELRYQLSLGRRLGFLPGGSEAEALAGQSVRVLGGLIRALRAREAR